MTTLYYDLPIKITLYEILEKLEAQQIYKLSSKIFFHDDNT